MGRHVKDGRVRGMVFDMDGTLTDSPLDFDLIRSECGIPLGQPILEHLARSTQEERLRVQDVLARHERRAAEECTLKEGVHEALAGLAERGMRTALLTRNSAESVRTVLRRFALDFDCWLSREDAAPKPSPEPVLKIADRLALVPQELLVVGDYVFDVQAGRAAGARTAFVTSRQGYAPPPEADYVIDDLRELLHLVPGGRADA